ncbi:benzoate/H(+) symporter BenE family transporter [Pseudomonas aeruginosa]
MLISSLPGSAIQRGDRRLHRLRPPDRLCGVTGSFERLMRQVPLLAGLGAAGQGAAVPHRHRICNAAEQQTLLVLAMFFSYLLCKRFSPRYAVFAARYWCRGCCWPGYWANWTSAGSAWNWRYPGGPHRAASPPPSASGIPLFIVAMASQGQRAASPCCAPTATRCQPRR